MARNDIQQEVTDRIIAALEKGGMGAWQKPWATLGQADQALPYNFSTGKAYRGVNTWSLLFEALDKGYSSNGWLTFKQAQALGGNVRKGERGTMAVKYLIREVGQNAAENDEDASDDSNVRRIPSLRSFTLFNLDQIDGIERPVAVERPVMSDMEKITAIERLVGLQAASGLTYRRVGNRACYSPASDSIAMPAGEFETGEHYAATLAHELVHATGHKRRLDRFATNNAKFPDKNASYAFEELVAELGAAMICAEHSIVGDHLQHESYIDSWLSELKRDKTLIFKAAKLAAEAHDFLMGTSSEAVVDEAA